MTIEKNNFKVARLDPEFHSPHSRDTVMSSDEDDEFQRRNSISAVESDDEEFEECDSGAGSDDFDLLDLGETGEEFCQVYDQTCSIPYDLYDLSCLKDVLSMEVWNEVLTEEERFRLSKYLPDMDQENFVCTLKEIFCGDNLHFGSPVDKLFEMLKGGLCEPRVALYRQGLNFFQRKEHYHNLRKYQNTMVSNLCQMRDVWANCKGYSIDEKLRVLNIVQSQKSIMNENMEEFGSESSEKEDSGDGLWGKKLNDRKLGKRKGRHSEYISPAADSGRKTTTEPGKNGKRNPKGTLKLVGPKPSSTKELIEPFPSSHPGIEMKSGRYGLGVPLSRNSKESVYQSSAVGKRNEHTLEDDEAENVYELPYYRDRNVPRVGATDRASKRKKHESPRLDEDMDYMGVSTWTRNNLHALDRNKAINKLSDIEVLTAKPSNMSLHQFVGENPMKFGKSQKGSQMGLFDANDPAWLGKHGELFPHNLSTKTSDPNAKIKKWKMGAEDADVSENGKLMHTKYRAMSLQDKLQPRFLQTGRRDSSGNRGLQASVRNEDTESDSSEHDDDYEDDNPLMRSKWAFPGPDTKRAGLSKRDKKNSHLTIDGSSHTRKMESYSENLELMKPEHTGAEDQRHFFPLGRNGHVEGKHGNGYHMQSVKSSHNATRRQKGETSGDFSHPQPNYMPGINFEDDLYWTQPLEADNGLPFKLGKKGRMVDDHRSDMPILGYNLLSKKRKMKGDLGRMDLQNNADTEIQLEDIISTRKRGKKKPDTSNVVDDIISQPLMKMEMEEVEPESKPQKKSFPLITPTVHTGFSFSIIHLLSAVRMTMITLLPEDSSESGKPLDKNDSEHGIKDDQRSKREGTDNGNSNTDMQASTSAPVHTNVPSLTIQEIVNRVKSNPGDPCILETQEPLQDLVRGVLKIFSSRTAPLGAKGWKPLLVYERSTKSWSWTGPMPLNLSDSEDVEEVTSPDAWGLPHKMLVKLVDSFANWLKNSQETLQQIGSLPAPPLTLMQMNLDEKERFKDLRAQKSLSTISPSSEEVRTYFRKEEVLRYLIPDRAFSYTAVDGKKSIVAPLRRCGGKPTSKARDHFMLKRDRPPHVTILCLVRDAAARLPGSIGTRADVCTLIRDSQYIVEEVSDAQVNQVVSGALDRLHYERDPCVQFDGERKLWVYLHREREEEDFEDDGTSSTKKWRRQKKEPTEPGDVTVAFPGNMGQSGGDLVSDLNVEASGADDDKKSEPDYQNGNDHHIEDNAETSPARRNGFGLKSVEENKLLCQENSTNRDFDEDAYGGEPPS